MKLEKKHWIIIGVVVAIILVWYFFFKKKKTESNFMMPSGRSAGRGRVAGKPCPKGWIVSGTNCVPPKDKDISASTVGTSGTVRNFNPTNPTPSGLSPCEKRADGTWVSTPCCKTCNTTDASDVVL